jgi:hypothetical protein
MEERSEQSTDERQLSVANSPPASGVLLAASITLGKA